MLRIASVKWLVRTKWERAAQKQSNNLLVFHTFSTCGGVNVFTEETSQDFPLWCAKNKDLDFRDGVTFRPLKGKVGLVRGGFGDTQHSIEFWIPGFVIPGSLRGLNCLLCCVGWLWWIWHLKVSSPPPPFSLFLILFYFILRAGFQYEAHVRLKIVTIIPPQLPECYTSRHALLSLPSSSWR